MLTGWRRFADHHPRLVEAALLLLYAATGGQYLGDRPGWRLGLPIATAACLSLL